MNIQIETGRLYWASFNRFELRLIGSAVLDIAQSGDNGPAVDFWALHIRSQVDRDAFANRPTRESLREELSEYGAWSDEDLSDDWANFKRLCWLAAWNIAEDESPDCSEPLTPAA
jgi:hypothetical protein